MKPSLIALSFSVTFNAQTNWARHKASSPQLFTGQGTAETATFGLKQSRSVSLSTHLYWNTFLKHCTFPIPKAACAAAHLPCPPAEVLCPSSPVLTEPDHPTRGIVRNPLGDKQHQERGWTPVLVNAKPAFVSHSGLKVSNSGYRLFYRGVKTKTSSTAQVTFTM